MPTQKFKNHHQQTLAGRCMRGSEKLFSPENELRGRLIKG